MKPAIILDRDGVINDHRHFVNEPADLILFDTAPMAIRKLNNAGYKVVVATNQGGVGLGYLSADMLDRIHEKLVEELAAHGARIDDIAACTHSPHAGCDCRKPRPGLLYALQERHDLDLDKSYMVGDRETDVAAGKAAGTKTVLIGDGPSAADLVAADLAEAVDLILKEAHS
jgi:D-glycero-D-manno-heptose 1,7-bisphosphate phosphatase